MERSKARDIFVSRHNSPNSLALAAQVIIFIIRAFGRPSGFIHCLRYGWHHYIIPEMCKPIQVPGPTLGEYDDNEREGVWNCNHLRRDAREIVKPNRSVKDRFVNCKELSTTDLTFIWGKVFQVEDPLIHTKIIYIQKEKTIAHRFKTFNNM